MKLCQCMWLWRLSRCLALALILLCFLPGEGFAADGGGAVSVPGAPTKVNTSDSTDFPYLGPDKERAKMLEGAFAIQSRLFGAVSLVSSGGGGGGGAASGFKALNILAGFATMIGALLFFFNQKYWRKDIIFSWLILVVIMLFAPFGSKLLFYKTPHISIGIGESLLGQQAVPGDCSENYVGCGLTVQLAAIDLASRLQVAVAGVFKSNDFRNLVSEAFALEKLRKTDVLVADVGWLERIEAFRDKCGTNLVPVLENTSSKVGVSSAKPKSNDAGVIPLTLQDVWGDITNQYLTSEGKTKDGFDATPPPVIVLYDESDLGQSETIDKGAYAAGINALYQALVSTGDNKVQVSYNGSDAGTISIKTALDQMKDSLFLPLDTSANGSRMFSDVGIMPGFFFVRNSDVQDDNAQSVLLRRCYVAEDRTMTAVGKAFTKDTCLNGLSGKVKDFADTPKQLENFRDINAILKGGKRQVTVWSALGKVFRQPEVLNMPVGRADVRFARTATGSDGKVELDRRSASQGFNCADQGRQLIEDGVKKSLGKVPGIYDPAISFLLDKSVAEGVIQKADSNDGHLKLDDVLTEKAQKARDTKEVGEALKDYWNGTLRNQLILESKAAAEKKHLLIVQMTLNLIADNTRIFKNKTLPEKKTGEKAVQEAAENVNSNVIRNPIMQLLGNFSYGVGTLLVNVGAFFTGSMAQAFLGFINMVVQLSILVLIVLTPFLFLAGLVIPSVAMGVITTAVMGVFVLQFVPVTIIILNFLGGLVYDVVGAVNSSYDTYTMQSMIIIAMSGLYTGVVALTFFMIFKMGDPNAVLGRLVGLDSAAKQMAEAGEKVVIGTAATLATATSAGALGSLLGVVGNIVRNSGADASALGIANAAIAGARNLEQRNPDGQQGGTPGDPTNPDGTPPVPGFTSAVSQTEDPEAFDNEQAALMEGIPLDERGRAAAELQNPNNNGVWTDPDSGRSYMLGKDRFGQDAVRLADNTIKIGDVARSVDLPTSGGRGPASAATDVIRTGTDASGTGAAAAPRASAEDRSQQASSASAQAAPQAGDGQAAPQANDQAASARSAARAAQASPSAAAAGGPVQSVSVEVTPSVSEAEYVDKLKKAKAGMRQLTETQLGQEIAQMALKITSDPSLTQEQKDELVKKLSDAQPTEVIGEMQSNVLADLALQDVQKSYASMRKGGAKLTAPTAGQAAWSGFVGGFSAVFGGPSSIPVIGKILKEATNEYYQAPERARMWNEMGGAAAVRRLKDRAQRMSYYEKEVSSVSGGFRYENMVSVDGFGAQISQARQTAAEAVAVAKSQDEAIRGRAMEKTGEKRDYFVAADYAGLGRMNAIQKLKTLEVEAARMQSNQALTVKVLDAENPGKLTEMKIGLTHRVLDELSTGVALKNFNSSLEDQLKRHYGVIEKQYMRGSKWDETRDMRNNAESMNKFSSEDVGTDYMTAGHMQMVQGKQEFKKLTGMYKAYLGLRNANTAKIEQYLQDNDTLLENELKKKDVDITNDKKKYANLKPAAQRAAKIKLAKEKIGEHNLPLDAIFAEAETAGFNAITTKSREARSSVQAMMQDTNERVWKNQQFLFDVLGSKMNAALYQSVSIQNDRNGAKLVMGTPLVKAQETFFRAAKDAVNDPNRAAVISDEITQELVNLFTKVGDKEGALFGKDVSHHILSLRGEFADGGKGVKMAFSEEAFTALSKVLEEKGLSAVLANMQKEGYFKPSMIDGKAVRQFAFGKINSVGATSELSDDEDFVQKDKREK